jgi:hypothetical protein
MKKELSMDYDITVDNMIPMTKEQELGNFKLHETKFGSQKKEGLVKMNVLTIGQAGCDGCMSKIEQCKYIVKVGRCEPSVECCCCAFWYMCAVGNCDWDAIINESKQILFESRKKKLKRLL